MIITLILVAIQWAHEPLNEHKRAFIHSETMSILWWIKYRKIMHEIPLSNPKTKILSLILPLSMDELSCEITKGIEA